jgi:flagellar protein FlgJ
MQFPTFLSPTPTDFDATFVNGSRPTVRALGQEMETMFLSMLLKQMRESHESEGDGLFPGDTGDVYGGLFDFYMSKHLAEAGGIGLGSTWTDQLLETQLKESPRYAPGIGGTNPGASLSRAPGI